MAKIIKLIVVLSIIALFSALVQAGSSCFLPGTLITMGNGSQIPIENVKIGDKILSYDGNLNPVITKVLETESPMRDDYYIMTFENGKELKVTNEHPLYIKSAGYEGWGSIIPKETLEDSGITAKKIEVGDHMLNIEKKWIKIANIQHVNEKVQTYNLKKVDKTNTFFAEGFLAHNKGGGGGAPPPPPPPCATKKAGCYNTENKRTANPGETFASVDFAYYHPEESCIRSGGCDCRGFPEDITDQTNPDSSAYACSCITGTQHNQNAASGQQCCGDDKNDCGMISKRVLMCSVNSEGEGTWLSTTTNVGGIRYVGCANAEYFSDGNTWTKCDGAWWVPDKKVKNSQYICIGRGKESIAECCGDYSCNSVASEAFGGRRLATGQTINPSDFVNEAESITAPAPKGTCMLLNPLGKIECGSGSEDASCVCISSATIQERFQSCGEVPKDVCETRGEDTTCHQEMETVCTALYRCNATEPVECGGIQGKNCPSGYFCKYNTNQITGNVVSSGDAKTYYCRSDGKFVHDLDTPSLQIGDTALNTKNEKTCKSAGFTWTGTKCCSEADDPNEYYNDPEGAGGCWDGKPVPKDQNLAFGFVDGTGNSVASHNGEFHGCAIDKKNFNTNNDNLLEIPDKHTGAPLIANHDYCFTDPDNTYYCSFTERWIRTDGTDRTHFSYAPVQNAKQAGECCAQYECWDGENCRQNQKNIAIGSDAQPVNGYRCIDGQWTISGAKSTPDNSVGGFCPSDSQCLLNPSARNESVQCIKDGDYAEDNYCEKGNWSSRTKLLALKLLELKSGDYTLFCDNRNNTLNNLQFLTGSGELVSNVLEGLQANNFCIIKFGDDLIAATSINRKIEDISRPSIMALGISGCNNPSIPDDDRFYACDSQKVWVNKAKKSFIYSTKEITLQSSQGLLSSFDRFLGSPIRNLIDSIKRLITNPPFDQSYVKGIKKFDKLYLTQQGGKSIIGSLEGKTIKNAVIQYIGFDTDICKFVDQFNQAKKDISSGVSCKKEGNNYYVLAQGGQFSNINPDLIWLDLTSKLRLK